MEWNWQKPNWPNFEYNPVNLEKLERNFQYSSGMLKGEFRHIEDNDQEQLTIELISTEAFMTSKIEGEELSRDSLQSSIRRNLGLHNDHRRIPPAEAGISEMIVGLWKTYADPLTHEMLFNWHKMLMNGRTDILIGGYRTDSEPMQVVSGKVYDPKIHFEAPPSPQVNGEMEGFIEWFNETGPKGKKPLSPLTRAGLAHIYFESIHPFDDGNGRIGRALVEKALSQSLGYPTLIALSHTIQAKKKAYYGALEFNNKDMNIDNWLTFFAEIILKAQEYTLKLIHFLIAKAKLYRSIKDKINVRQEKALERMFREGLEGFKGGMSAENYMAITGAPRSTATYDLKQLVEMGTFIPTGELKGRRYHLNIKGWQSTE